MTFWSVLVLVSFCSLYVSFQNKTPRRFTSFIGSLKQQNYSSSNVAKLSSNISTLTWFHTNSRLLQSFFDPFNLIKLPALSDFSLWPCNKDVDDINTATRQSCGLWSSSFESHLNQEHVHVCVWLLFSSVLFMCVWLHRVWAVIVCLSVRVCVIKGISISVYYAQSAFTDTDQYSDL